jgi:hypothetical protein
MTSLERRVRVAGGKTLVLKVECLDGAVKGLRLQGDFFFHPEDGLAQLESFLLASSAWQIDDPEAAITRFMDEKRYRALGFAPADLAYLLRGLKC